MCVETDYDNYYQIAYSNGDIFSLLSLYLLSKIKAIFAKKNCKDDYREIKFLYFK